MNLYSLLLDAMVLLLALWFVVSAYRKGFLRSVLLAVGVIASVAAAVMLSGPAARFTYSRFLEKPVTEGVKQALASGVESLELEQTVRSAVDALPGIVTNPLLASFGGEEGLIDALLGSASDGTQKIAAEVVAPIVISMLQALMCLLIFAVCVIIVRMLASAFSGFNRVPVLGPVNAALGAVVGVIQAAIVIYLLAMLASVVVSLTGDKLSWLNTGIIGHTYLFRLFLNMPLLQ